MSVMKPMVRRNILASQPLEMTSILNKNSCTISSFTRVVLCCILISVWLISVFLTLAPWIPLPIGAAVQSYFYRVGKTAYLDLPAAQVIPEPATQNGQLEENPRSDLFAPFGNVAVPANVNSAEHTSSESSQNVDSMENVSSNTTSTGSPQILNAPTSLDTLSGRFSSDSECDLSHGEWFYDPAGPLYMNDSCSFITQLQNCQGNGRPDWEYENWRWKPTHCQLPRFNATKFLELMTRKTLAFVGDSVSRNQMESLLCLLSQVEVPRKGGNRHMQRWYFTSRSVTIVRIWSSWLVHQTYKPFSYLPKTVVKLHLDVPDETFMQFLPTFDVVVVSSGHWFAKQSVYLLKNKIVGTQLWSPPDQKRLKMNKTEAFGVSIETSLTAMVTHPNYTGLTILRSYSPDHYEGGAWNTGGSCTGKLRPASREQLIENGFTKVMHEKQLTGFHQAIKKRTNQSKLRFMDITEMFSYRHDGHPGPYRNLDPNKITKREPDGRPPPQDCLHWCMPGPVETWNELMLEIIRREFESDHKNSIV